VALGFSIFGLVGAWSEFRLDEGDRFGGYTLLALCAPIFAVMAATLLRGWSEQRKTTRLLYAWTAAVDQPATAPPTSQPRQPIVYDDDSRPWQTALSIPQGSQQKTGGFAYGDRSPRPALYILSRAAWAVAGAVGVLFGSVSVAASVYENPNDTNISGEEDALAGALMSAGWGAVLAVAGVLALRKAFRLASRTRRVEADPDALTKGPAHPVWIRGKRVDRDAKGRLLGPDLLRRVTPGSAFDRRHRNMPTAVLVLAAGLVAAAVMLLAGGFLGTMAIIPAIPLALILVAVLFGYCRRALWPVLALIVVAFVFWSGFWLEQQRVLAERGVWVEATVVGIEEEPEYHRCVLEFHDGRPSETLRCGYGMGSEVDVLVDPEREVMSSFDSASPTAYTVLSLSLGAVFTGSVMAGAFTGHRFRRNTPSPPRP
jgi:hypothetical protein